MGSKKKIAFFLGILTLGVYLLWQTKSIYGGDAGDLVSAAYLKGVAHPPGYPLYTFLGYLLTKLPYSTVAARVGLLSVIPSGLTIVVLFLLISKITAPSHRPRRTTSRLSTRPPRRWPAKNCIFRRDSCEVKFIPALIACLTLAFCYLFWLYAEVPEVFGLYGFFVVLLTYILYLWSEKKNKRLLYLFSFIFGLSLCHHHIILFLVPGFAYWIYTHRKILPKINFSFLISHFSFFISGLLPYSYVYFAAKGSPAINWDNPVNFKNFLRLLTRADYGTFTSGAVFSKEPFLRLAQLIAFFETLEIDFTRLGIFLILLGAIFEFKKRRTIFFFNLLAISFGGLFFVFYAGFPLISNFFLGTFERFLLPSYIFFSIWLAEGIIFFSTILTKALFFIRHSERSEESQWDPSGFALRMTSVIFLLLPLCLFYANFPKISILKNDFTAEHLAEDIFYNLPSNSILLLMDDTSLFDAQYLYYTKKKRPDIELIHIDKLAPSCYFYYREKIKESNPRLKIPQEENFEKFLPLFFKENYSSFSIYSNPPLPVPEEFVWVPEGLVNRLYKKEEALSAQEFLIKSKEIWQRYHNPLEGSLSQYKNLMLSDVLRVYNLGRIITGQVLLKAGYYQEAEDFFEKAVELFPESIENYKILGEAFFYQNECQQAKESFEKAISLDSYDKDNYSFLAKIYKECFKEAEKALEYEKIYERLKKEGEGSLEKL